MKWLIFLFLLLLFAPYSPQLRTRYHALPVVRRARVWGVQAGRWVFVVGRVAQ